MSAHTLFLYETQFKSGLIEDVFGRITMQKETSDETVLADYTIDNWTDYVKALWAMLRAGADLARAEHREYEPIPGFEEWSVRATNLDMSEVSRVVINNIQEKLFRSGAAASDEKTSE
jgi:hypothetical protein